MYILLNIINHNQYNIISSKWQEHAGQLGQRQRHEEASVSYIRALSRGLKTCRSDVSDLFYSQKSCGSVCIFPVFFIN